jgi:putative ABC transport system permease protein
MRYAVETIWFDRRRYLPAVLAVALSSALIALQVGIMIGLIGTISKPVDSAPAQIWVCAPDTCSIDMGMPIPMDFANRISGDPLVRKTEAYVQGSALWKNPREGNVLCVVMGCNLADDSLGPVTRLTAAQRLLLTETDAVILDAADCRRLAVDHVGQVSEVFGHRVRVVAFIENMGNLADPYVICSLRTARRLLGMGENRTTYILAQCAEPNQVPSLLRRLRNTSDFSAYSAQEFSWKSKAYWLARTKVGIAVGFFAALGLLVGAMVTSQTLYAATMASVRELAILRALGASRWCLRIHVLEQSFLVGLLGTIVGVPMILGLARIASVMGTEAVMPWWLLLGTSLVTLLMAVLSGLLALRSLRQADPVILLR